MAPTMREIAEIVGVSIPTVSRVLRGTADEMVTAATHARILQVADEIGYHPNPHARALVRGKATSIVVLAPNSPHSMNTLKTWTLCNALGELGRDIMVIGVDGSSSRANLAAMLYASAPEAAVILTSGWTIAELDALCRQLHAREIWPLVVDPVRWRPGMELAGDAVVLHRAQGAALAVSHLVECGHRHVGLITGGVSEARALGYEQALAAHGITDRFVEITAGPNADVAARCGQEAAQRLLRRYPEVTGLFCYSDIIALGAMKGVERMGLRVPDDVAVAGFDDQSWTAYLPVPLTTVAQPVGEMCRAAARLLAKRVAGDAGPWRLVDVSPELVVRESTAIS